MVGVIPESIRLYAVCKAMNWTHLPVSGGLYDQSPKLLDEWFYIMGEEAKERARKEAKEKHKSKAGRMGGRKRR